MSSLSLFDPWQLRDVQIRNRIFLPPMCQYQATGFDGMPTSWHLVHYGARATGGFGLIMLEATGVQAAGRISTQCLGLWNDEQRDALVPIVDFAHSQGAKIGVQLVHAGRKASTYPSLPGYPNESVPIAEGGWETFAPSALSVNNLRTPHAMTIEQIRQLIGDFVAAAERAVVAGFDTVEIHAAHGYLLHQFLSPISNHRSDDYGGSLENRMRLTLEIITAIRDAIPAGMPLLMRISATDWLEDTTECWTVADSVVLARRARELGVDVIDVSSGGLVPAPIRTGPGYQVPLAAAIREEIPVIAVGQMSDPQLAQSVLMGGQADAIDVGRAALVDPAWPLHAANALEIPRDLWPLPASYHRAI